MFSGTSAATESRIVTLGLIDIENRRAGGFGLGKVPILSVSAQEIRFGSSALDEAPGAQRIEGSFDLVSGDLRIIVRPARRPSEISIRMELSCHATEPLF